MSLAPHTLSSRGRTRPGKRVGRGNSSQKGTSAGRGTKGQKSRSGGRGGLKLKSLRKSIMKVPKVRGFKSFHPEVQAITLKNLDAKTTAGQMVTPKWLESVGLIRNSSLPVKIIATGVISKAVTIKECQASKGAVALIEKAGGTLVF